MDKLNITICRILGGCNNQEGLHVKVRQQLCTKIFDDI